MTKADEGDKKPLSRRDFLRLAWGSALGRAEDAVARGIEEAKQVLPRGPRRRFTGRVYIGAREKLEAIPAGMVMEGYAQSEHFFLVRVQEGWLALHNRCTTRSCRLTWEHEADNSTRGFFHCQRDQSTYDLYGEVVSGPAPYPLETLAIEEVDGGVFVRTDTVRPRITVTRETDPTRL